MEMEIGYCELSQSDICVAETGQYFSQEYTHECNTKNLGKTEKIISYTTISMYELEEISEMR
jgi:hypothetical protein